MSLCMGASNSNAFAFLLLTGDVLIRGVTLP